MEHNQPSQTREPLNRQKSYEWPREDIERWSQDENEGSCALREAERKLASLRSETEQITIPPQIFGRILEYGDTTNRVPLGDVFRNAEKYPGVSEFLDKYAQHCSTSGTTLYDILKLVTYAAHREPGGLSQALQWLRTSYEGASRFPSEEKVPQVHDWLTLHAEKLLDLLAYPVQKVFDGKLLEDIAMGTEGQPRGFGYGELAMLRRDEAGRQRVRLRFCEEMENVLKFIPFSADQRESLRQQWAKAFDGRLQTPDIRSAITQSMYDRTLKVLQCYDNGEGLLELSDPDCYADVIDNLALAQEALKREQAWSERDNDLLQSVLDKLNSAKAFVEEIERFGGSVQGEGLPDGPVQRDWRRLQERRNPNLASDAEYFEKVAYNSSGELRVRALMDNIKNTEKPETAAYMRERFEEFVRGLWEPSGVKDVLLHGDPTMLRRVISSLQLLSQDAGADACPSLTEVLGSLRRLNQDISLRIGSEAYRTLSDGELFVYLGNEILKKEYGKPETNKIMAMTAGRLFRGSSSTEPHIVSVFVAAMRCTELLPGLPMPLSIDAVRRGLEAPRDSS